MNKQSENCGEVLAEMGFVFEPQMGGNCTAYGRYNQDGECHVLVTVEHGGAAPETLDEVVDVGWYPNDATKSDRAQRLETGVLRDLLAKGALARREVKVA